MAENPQSGEVAQGTASKNDESADRSTTKRPGFGGKLRAGVVGALALTALHEGARRFVADAPRMDTVGARALARALDALGLDAPKGEKRYWTTLAGDVLSNALLYTAFLSRGTRRSRLRATLAGAAAGYAAYALPPLLGLGHNPHARRRSNRAMTVAWYAIGGFVAAAAYARQVRSVSLNPLPVRSAT